MAEGFSNGRHLKFIRLYQRPDYDQLTARLQISVPLQRLAQVDKSIEILMHKSPYSLSTTINKLIVKAAREEQARHRHQPTSTTTPPQATPEGLDTTPKPEPT